VVGWNFTNVSKVRAAAVTRTISKPFAMNHGEIKEPVSRGKILTRPVGIRQGSEEEQIGKWGGWGG
jgi:hypothetical protein